MTVERRHAGNRSCGLGYSWLISYGTLQQHGGAVFRRDHVSFDVSSFNGS